MSVSALSKEQQKAYTMFQTFGSNPEFRLSGALLSEDHPLLPTNFMASSTFSIEKSHIPKEPHWEWAQSNSRVTVVVDESKITFRKLNPRRKFANMDKPPALKVWLFDQVIGDSIINSFLWCEKGVGSCEGINTPLGFIYPQFLSENDFSFLSPFMDKPPPVRQYEWIQIPC